MSLDPNKPHEFVVGSDGIRCQVCARSNSIYGRPYHTPPFQVEPIDAPMPSFAEHTFGARSERMRTLREAAERDIIDAVLGRKPSKCSCERGEKTPFNCWSCDRPNAPAVSNSTGGEPENTNGGTMKLNLTLNAKGVESVLPIIAALNAIDGVTVEDIKEADPPPVYRSSTRIATNTDSMRRMLRQATEDNSAVILDYTTASGERNRARRVTPAHFEDDLLLAVDPNRGHRLRSFKLDRIASVTLP